MNLVICTPKNKNENPISDSQVHSNLILFPQK